MIANKNKVELIGSIQDKPQIVEIGRSQKMTIMLNTNIPIMKDGDEVNEHLVHKVILWGTLAMQHEHLEAGQTIHVVGRINYRSFENKTGIRIWVTEIIASAIYL